MKEQCWAVTPCPYPHCFPSIWSCTELVYPGCWHLDNGAESRIDDVLLEHGVLPHVLPLTVHLELFLSGQI